MKRIPTLLAAAVLMALPALGHAQTWSNSSPSITANATVQAVRQFNTTDYEVLNFGSIVPGTAVTIGATTSDGTAGTTGPNSAKVNIRFNKGTKVTVTTPATLSSGTATITPTSFSCFVANSKTDAAPVAFTTDCATGHEWTNATVTGMVTKWVLIGGSLDAAATQNAAAGTYSGSITIVLDQSAT